MRDLTEQKFTKLAAIRPISRDRNGHYRWLCVCDCGKEHSVLDTHLVYGKIRSCGCTRPRARDRKQWTGHGEISGRFWSQIKRGAMGAKGRSPIPFEVTIEQVWELYQKQDGRCALTDLPIPLPYKYGDTQVASLDRIDSAKGYTLDNVQWIHKDINKMKNSFDQEYFIEMCKKVAAGSCEV